MKLKWLGLLLASCALSGCYSLSDDCYDHSCWNMSIQHSRCGKCIVDHCQRYCDACTFNEPACNACRACSEHEECQLLEERGRPMRPVIYRAFYRVQPSSQACLTPVRYHSKPHHKLYRVTPY